MATVTKSKPKSSKVTRPPAKKTVKSKAPEATFVSPAAKKSVPKKKASPAKTKTETPGKVKTPSAKVGKKATAKPSGKGSGGQSLPRVMNEHGFVVGSDSEKIVEVLLEGGVDRSDINAKVMKIIGKRKTRNGNDQNVSSLIANVLKRLKDKGYSIESSWVLVPPTEEEKAKAARKAKRTKGAGKKPASA